MGERLLCKQEVVGSIPIGSTSSADPASRPAMGGVSEEAGFAEAVAARRGRGIAV